MSLPVITDFPQASCHGLLAGPCGGLEAVVVPGERRVSAVICHPHPLQEGTMHNKVVTTLHRTFHQLGVNTLRFNYRGVGESAGEFADTVGEVEDCLSALSWLQQQRPEDEIWLAGFSFGAYIAAKVATLKGCQQLVTVAPPVHYPQFAQLPEIACPWILIQGDLDDVVSAKEVYAWCDQRQLKPELICLDDAGHFFHGKLVLLKQKLLEKLAPDHDA